MSIASQYCLIDISGTLGSRNERSGFLEEVATKQFITRQDCRYQLIMEESSKDEFVATENNVETLKEVHT